MIVFTFDGLGESPLSILTCWSRMLLMIWIGYEPTNIVKQRTTETTSLNFLKSRNVNPEVLVTEDWINAKMIIRSDNDSSRLNSTIHVVCNTTRMMNINNNNRVCDAEKRKLDILVGDFSAYNNGFRNEIVFNPFGSKSR